MSCKPLIGLNADFRSKSGQTPAYLYQAAGYFQAVEAAGAIPVIIPPLKELDSIQSVLEQLHGFVLVGGADLDPRNDGYMLHSSIRLMDPLREAFDRMLMAEISERRLPVFGIGAGLQLMNVNEGGNLFLDLREDLPSSVPHRDLQDASHRHTLDVVRDSLVGRVYGEGEIRVNSRHHMAIDEVAPGFRVTARCPDGVIEAIESEMMDWFAIGTQFHPESDAASALDCRLFEEFVEGVTARMQGDLRLVA
ncbi:gamma-glutamyl-gamma-aminobutyrate hydrolase family protein [Planctomycetaceae bacterium SH139]|jgi:putative glutamine amidotransferase